MIAQQSPILEKAANTLLAFSEDEIARDRIRRIKMAEADKRIQIMEAKREGMEEGREEGMDEIIKLIEKGLSVDEIKKIRSQKQRRT
jgi:hypothetical protein